MTLKVASDYVDLVTCEHADKPRFVATVSRAVQPYVDHQVLLGGLASAFDLDLAAGPQLDVVGAWVGVSRLLPIPVANVYFAFDVDGVGFDQGYFKGPFDEGTLLASLDDETYRRLIRAKIAANAQDGTAPDAQTILDGYFFDPATFVIVQDNGRSAPAVPSVGQSMTIGVAGRTPTLIDLEILAQGLIPVVPGGVASEVLVASVNGASLFGFDLANPYVAGFDQGAIGASPADIAGGQSQQGLLDVTFPFDLTAS